MSYSRWINSRFYTYMNPDLDFVIQGEMTLTELEVRELLVYMERYLMDCFLERLGEQDEQKG